MAKHNVAQIGPKFVIPRLRVYLTPDRKSFVEYTAAANKVRVVTEGGEKLFSVEESTLPADKLPAPRGGVTASGSSTVPTFAEGDTAWYKTWWGITGIVLAGGGATYAVYRATKKNKQIPTL
jgi:hypothetical protein